MSIKYFLVILLFFSVASVSCSDQKQHKFQIVADITGMPEQRILLEELGFNESWLVDSTHSDKNGHFILSGSYNQPGLYSIKLGNQFMLIVVDGAHISLSGDWNHINEYQTTGSPGTQSLMTFLRHYTTVNKELIGLKMAHDSLIRQTGSDSVLSALEATSNKTHEQLITYIKRFSDTTKSLPAAIFAASKLLMSPDETEYLNKFAGSLSKRFDHAPMINDFKQVVDAKVAKEGNSRSPKRGSMAPDFTATSLTGETVKLSSFRGQYVLIDFWASWCPPCRAENPNVVAAYHAFKDKKFTVLGVSLDDDRNKWQDAVKKDRLEWTQVSELAGWDSQIVQLYDVQAIPMNFLIDPSGKVLASNLRGDKLQQTLQQYLGAPAGGEVAIQKK